MRRRRLIWHIFPSFALVIALTVTVTVWNGNRTAHDVLKAQTRQHLRSAAEVGALHAAEMLGAGRLDAFSTWAKQVGSHTPLRITVIMPDGKVVADSQEDPARMENHADRPEIKDAMKGHTGERTGFSSTLHKRMMYVAAPVLAANTPIAVCRTSAPVASLEAVGRDVAHSLAATGVFCALLGALVSLWLSRRITSPVRDMQVAADRLAEGDFSARLRLPDSRELAKLASRFNSMATQLEERIHTVTRQKEEAETILASMIEGVIAIDQEQNIINMNDAAARMLGIQRDDVCGRSIQEVVRNPGLYDAVTRTLERREPVEGDILLRDDANETHLQVHGSRLPTPGHAGQTGAVLVLNDVTRLRRLEAVRKQFAANVSHELRTPITSIKGFVETLLDGALENRDDTERFLRIILAHAERLNALVTDLLSLAGIEKGAETGDIALTRLPLAPELTAAAASRGPRAEDKGMSLQVDCPHELRADLNQTLFGQALVNLIDNAVTYSESGTTVRVVAERHADTLRIAVIDQGRGIPAEHLGRLFERFYRVDKSRSRDEGGTGLGLAIVKHVVQAHGGRVEVDSTPGKGSTFTIVLPAR